MQAKHLIIIAIVGILALLGFSLLINARTEKAIEANTPVASTSTPTANNDSVGNIPKATLDRANSQINQANADTANKMAETEKLTQ